MTIWTTLEAWKNQSGFNTNAANDITWSSITVPFAGEINSCAFVTNGFVYTVGGNPSNAVWRAPINSDGTLGTWVQQSNFPVTVANAKAFITKGRVYIASGTFGGTKTGATYYAIIAADGTIGSWNSGPAMGANIDRQTFFVNQNTVYAIGGFNTSSVAVTNVFKATIATDGSIGSWSAGTALPSAYADAWAIETSSRVYLVFGSTTGGGNLASWLWATKNLDGTLGTWTTYTAATGRANGFAFATEDFVFIGGGLNGSFAATNSVYRAPINTDGSLGAWTQISNLPGNFYIGLATWLTSSKIFALGTSDTGSTTCFYTASFSGGANDYSRLNYEQSSSEIASSEEASSNRLLAERISSDILAHEAASSDAAASDKRIHDALSSDEAASSNFLLHERVSSDVLAHEEKSSDDAVSSDLKVLIGGESAASEAHIAAEAASSDHLLAEAVSSDLAILGGEASSDAVLQQEIASDIHNQVEQASSDKPARDALSSNEAASSDLQRAEAASSDQAIIVEQASSDLAVIRAQQSDAHLVAEAASSDRLAAEILSDQLLQQRREQASSSDKPAHDAASSDAGQRPGPFFFAWVDELDAFDPIAHTREDDDIFAFDIQQQEGDFAALALTVRNPRIGLLAPGRKQWCWFSWRDPQGALWPLYHGRIIGIPAEIQDNVIQMDFLARPSDFVTQKAALAADMQVAPYWDSIWFSDATRDNPDNVLESRPELWHTDRLSLHVTSSNVIDGEDGDLDFSTDQVFFDSVHVTYAQNPLRTVSMTATVSWDQIGGGNVAPQRGVGLSAGSVLQSYTGTGLAEAWPKPGASIGGGWSVASSSVSTQGAVEASMVGEISYPPLQQNGQSYYVDGGFDTSLGVYIAQPIGNIGWSYHVAIPNVTVTWDLTLGWAANRRKTETLSFTLQADVQDIVTMPDDGEVLALTMSSSELNAPIDPNGAIPLGSQTARGYFNTPRGAQSIEYLIAVARAHLLARARAVNVAFEIPFALWVHSGVTLRKNALIHDDRLPGGQAAGKIISYALALKDGAGVASISIGCTVGHDGAVTESRGAPDYCVTDYVDGEIPSSESPSSFAGEVFYQTFAEDFRLPFNADVAYTSQLGVAPNDDGIDLDAIGGRNVVMRLLNGNADGETQQDALSRFDCVVDAQGSLKATNTRFAQIELTVPDLTGGPFETDYAPTLTDLKVPKTIDMEAPSL